MNVEEIIKATAEATAKSVLHNLRTNGKLKHSNSTSFQKTIELLKLYPKLPQDHPVVKKIDDAFKVIEDHEYCDVLKSLYFDNMTIVEVADIYDCKYQNISKQRNKLITILARELFPIDVLNELLGCDTYD